MKKKLLFCKCRSHRIVANYLITKTWPWTWRKSFYGFEKWKSFSTPLKNNLTSLVDILAAKNRKNYRLYKKTFSLNLMSTTSFLAKSFFLFRKVSNFSKSLKKSRSRKSRKNYSKSFLAKSSKSHNNYKTF